ncbi:MAG: 2-(1,2-epoxy-1,2-dihydrophenyl)acetyl-CoA isomerase [Bacteroidia bacterium]|nr:2-(1,2-epoxy-1,2-dihydrophenyl)acetyl-CoA isomerase [Bacteroidia bacterium]
MSYQLIKFKIENGVAYISLNRPDVLNSFNREMATEVQSALDECKSNREVRAVLLTGEGKGFSAGQDLAEAIANNGPSIKEIVNKTYNPIILKIRKLEKPVVAAVNGVAAGAGANIALACDIVIAGKSASFIQAFSKIGLIPDSGGTFILPRLVGLQRATALTMLGDKIPAEQAQEMGMIYKVCEDDNLMNEATSMAEKLAKMPTRGLGLTKRGLNKAFFNDLESQLIFEEDLQDEAGSTYDYKEGVKAFIEKRKPEFKGE